MTMIESEHTDISDKQFNAVSGKYSMKSRGILFNSSNLCYNFP